MTSKRQISDETSTEFEGSQRRENLDRIKRTMRSELTRFEIRGDVDLRWLDSEHYHFNLSFLHLSEQEARALVEAAKNLLQKHTKPAPKRGDLIGRYVIESVSTGMVYYRDGVLHGVPASDVIPAPDGRLGSWVIGR